MSYLADLTQVGPVELVTNRALALARRYDLNLLVRSLTETLRGGLSHRLSRLDRAWETE